MLPASFLVLSGNYSSMVCLANRQNTSKLRKHLDNFDNTCTAFRKKMVQNDEHHNKPNTRILQVAQMTAECFRGKWTLFKCPLISISMTFGVNVCVKLYYKVRVVHFHCGQVKTKYGQPQICDMKTGVLQSSVNLP